MQKINAATIFYKAANVVNGLFTASKQRRAGIAGKQGGNKVTHSQAYCKSAYSGIIPIQQTN